MQARVSTRRGDNCRHAQGMLAGHGRWSQDYKAHYNMYTFYNFKMLRYHREEAAGTGRERAAHAAWPGPLAKHTGSGLDCGKGCSHLPKIVATLVCSRAVDRLRCLETVSQTTLPRNCLSRGPASETSGNCSLCQSKLSDLLAQQQTDNCRQNTTLNCSLYDRRQTTATLSPFEKWSAAK